MAVSIHPASARPAASALVAGERRRPTVIPYSPDGVALAAGIVVALALGVYVRTLLPSVDFWDTAEAQTVPHTLGIFHPTGFPTYTLVGWAWSQLPVGSVAYRMNLMSAVSVALAAGLVTLVAGHLITVSQPRIRAVAAGIAGAAFAFSSEPWENALRADVHALHIFLAAFILWLLFSWGAAVRAGSPRADRWLAGAALTFGMAMGNHPLIGLMAFGIAIWVALTEPFLWRRWRLVIACAVLLVVGIGLTYAYIPLRANLPPEPPLFYARPDTWERFRYLVFAEQFRDLFENFEAPLDNFSGKWEYAQSVLGRQLFGPGWLLVAMGAATLAVRRPIEVASLAAMAVANVFYSMNFEDGDIDRYYMTTVLVAAPLLGVAVASIASAAARAMGQRRFGLGRQRRRLLASTAGGAVLTLSALMPAAALVSLYEQRDRSEHRDADHWVASVYDQLPQNAVVISWWSYSTPLWYHRWVLGARPDVKIIDERNIVDHGYGTIAGAVRAYRGARPVYLVPPHWERDWILERWPTETVATYAGYSELLRIKEPGEP